MSKVNQKSANGPNLCRTRELLPGTEMDRYAAFALDSLKKTRARENVPSQEEIRSIVSRQDMSTTVHCHGGGSCKITIDSHTTAGEVSDSHQDSASSGASKFFFYVLSFPSCNETPSLGGGHLRWWRS